MAAGSVGRHPRLNEALGAESGLRQVRKGARAGDHRADVYCVTGREEKDYRLLRRLAAGCASSLNPVEEPGLSVRCRSSTARAVKVLVDMKWISASAYASAVALAAAVLSQALDWRTGRAWFLLVWAILLLLVLVGLHSHPMRWPAWGLFAGFWGVVGAMWLIAVQVLYVADVLRQPAYGAWAAWPLAVVAISIVVACGLGLGNQTFPLLVDVLGILTAVALLAISVATWIPAPDAAHLAAGVAAVLYSLWALCLGVVFWGIGPAGAEAPRGSVAVPLTDR